MEYRQLGASGLNVPVLSFGTATFGGVNRFFKAWGDTNLKEAKRLINVCLDAGINLFDTADNYSNGASEDILGSALAGLRHKALISTKGFEISGNGPNDFGSSRFHIIEACEASLKRLNTDHIDIYHMHGMDGNTPVEETLRALDDLVTSGKIRYIACSNFSGWHLMKSLAVSKEYGWNRYIAHQAYYSLLQREFEWELMPLGVNQNVGTLVWSPLSGGLLTGKFRRDQAVPENSRLNQGGQLGPRPNSQHLFSIIDAMDIIAEEVNKTVAQVALNWLLQRPTVSSLVLGARNEEQLQENLGAVGWNLTVDQIKKLDSASEVIPIYPYWHHRQNKRANPLPKFYR